MIFCLVLSTLGIIAGTWSGFPTLSPILVGFVAGFICPANAPRRSALAGLLAWGGLLAVAALRGDALVPFSKTLGGAMGIPGWGIILATLLYPAVLASSAAWFGSLVSPRRFASFDSGAASSTTPMNT